MKTRSATFKTTAAALAAGAAVLTCGVCASLWKSGGNEAVAPNDAAMVSPSTRATKTEPGLNSTSAKVITNRQAAPAAASSNGVHARRANAVAPAQSAPSHNSQVAGEGASEGTQGSVPATGSAVADRGRGGVNVLGRRDPSSEGEPQPPSIGGGADYLAITKPAPELLTDDEVAIVEGHKDLVSKEVDAMERQKSESASGNSAAITDDDPISRYRRLREILGPKDTRAMAERDMLAAQIGSDAVEMYELTERRRELSNASAAE